MTYAGLIPMFGALSAAVVAATAIIAVLARLFRPVALATGAVPQPRTPDETVFLFEGGLLSDATPAARHLIATLRADAPSLSAVAGHLARRFPGLRDRLRALEDEGEPSTATAVTGSDGVEQMRIDVGHGTLRLTLETPGTAASPESTRISALEDELRTLRSVAEDAPQLIWQQDDSGSLLWANRAYLALADKLSPRTRSDDPLWPARPILPRIRPAPEDGATNVTRVQVDLPGLVEPQWFEVTSVRRGATSVHFAVDASNIIAAEEGRQKFIQTLTKTFAHLSAGLVIFDRDRRLVLFNPAFLDLTTLPAAFLSQRPSVGDVLDRLRDLQMLPEPKDYSSWRDRVAALEAAAVRGTYCETWSLPSGRTYRVSGRPHPDGAIAFLFEDVSDEIHLTRHFRSELHTAQSVLDSLDDAIAVFSSAGTLMMSNAAYADLWGRGASDLGELGAGGELALWHDRAHPGPVWDRLRDSLAGNRDSARWQDTISLLDGRTMSCRFQSLSGGNALVAFRPLATDAVAKAETKRPRVVGGNG